MGGDYVGQGQKYLMLLIGLIVLSIILDLFGVIAIEGGLILLPFVLVYQIIVLMALRDLSTLDDRTRENDSIISGYKLKLQRLEERLAELEAERN